MMNLYMDTAPSDTSTCIASGTKQNETQTTSDHHHHHHHNNNNKAARMSQARQQRRHNKPPASRGRARTSASSLRYQNRKLATSSLSHARPMRSSASCDKPPPLAPPLPPCAFPEEDEVYFAIRATKTEGKKATEKQRKNTWIT